MAIFNSYVKLPEGNHHSSKALDIRCIMLGGFKRHVPTGLQGFKDNVWLACFNITLAC
jgi:hypothetical protein